jgi:hypothetical protein
MPYSDVASDLQCPHCGQTNAATQWPVNGDSVPFNCLTEPQREADPARFQVAVTCPHCRQAWYAVWQGDPGAIEDVDAPESAGSVRLMSLRALSPGSPSPAESAAAETVRFPCQCGAMLQAKVKHAGKYVKCPICSQKVVVPAQIHVPVCPQPDNEVQGVNNLLRSHWASVGLEVVPCNGCGLKLPVAVDAATKIIAAAGAPPRGPANPGLIILETCSLHFKRRGHLTGTGKETMDIAEMLGVVQLSLCGRCDSRLCRICKGLPHHAGRCSQCTNIEG